MALLARVAALPVAAALLLMSCNGSGEVGRVEFEMYQAPVICEAAGDCADTAGAFVSPEIVEGWAFVSTEVGHSEDSPLGLFVYAQGPLEGGGTGRLEIDVPAGAPTLYEASYAEYDDNGVRTFRSDSARGRARIPYDLLGERCDCLGGAFDFAFDASGVDGQPGTTDDAHRRLTWGRFGQSESAFCSSKGRVAPMVEDLELTRFNACPEVYRPATAPPERRSPAPSPSPSRDTTASCDDSTETASCDSDSSDSSASCDSDSSGSSSSCEGDSSSSSSSCEGDSSDSSASCDGDSSDSSASCEGDGSSSSSCEGDMRSVMNSSGLGSGRAQLGLFLGLVLIRTRRRAKKRAGRKPSARDTLPGCER